MNIVKRGEIPVGTHLILNVYNAELKYLETVDIGLQLLDYIVNELNLNVVAKDSHQFYPIGYTIAYILSESHLNIHTYPEYKSCFIDIFCCNPEFKPSDAINIVKSTFKTDLVTYTIINR
jgi:S-adenosylmethionine decarboxylase